MTLPKTRHIPMLAWSSGVLCLLMLVLLAHGDSAYQDDNSPGGDEAPQPKVEILAAPAYIMADSNLYLPIYFQVEDGGTTANYKDHIEIESATLTMTLNGTDVYTASSSDDVDPVLFAAGDYVTNAARWSGDEQTWRRANGTDTNNTRADYSAIIPPGLFHNKVAVPGAKDMTSDVTVTLTVAFKIAGTGDAVEATSAPVKLKAFCDDSIPSVTLGNSDTATSVRKNLPLCPPNGSNDKYGFKQRCYKDGVETFQQNTGATPPPTVPSSPRVGGHQDEGVVAADTPVFTTSRTTDAVSTTVVASGDDDVRVFDSWWYDKPGSPVGSNDAYKLNYIASRVDEKIGALAVSYYGYRKGFTAFAGGSSNLQGHTLGTDLLLDVRVTGCTFSPTLFGSTAGGTNGGVYLFVGEVNQQSASPLVLATAGLGIVAAVCAIPPTCGASVGWAWAVAGAGAGVIGASTGVWATLAPQGDAANLGSATFASAWQRVFTDSSGLPTTDPPQPVAFLAASGQIGDPSQNGNHACVMNPGAIPMNAPMTTWVGWMELGAKVEIRLGDYYLKPNIPNSFAKLCLNAGFNDATGGAFNVQVTAPTPRLTNQTIAANADFCY